MIARIFIKQKTKTGSPFDYTLPQGLKIPEFTLLLVPFGRKKKLGFLNNICRSSPHQTKEILEVLSAGTVFTSEQEQLAKKIAEQNLCAYGLTLFSFLPTLAKKHLRKIGVSSLKTYKNKRGLRKIFLGRKSDRRELFCQLISKHNSRQNLFLIPTKTDINETVKKIKKISPNLNTMSWHSGLSCRLKAEIWQTLLLGKPAVIIGSRDALLLPYSCLQTIFIDDPTNFAYQEDQLPYYNAYKVARLLADIWQSDLTIGDETPDLSAYINIQKRAVQMQNLPSEFHFYLAGSWSKLTQNESIYGQIETQLRQKKRLCILGPFKNQIKFFCRDCESQIKCPNCQGEQFSDIDSTCLNCGRLSPEVCLNCQSPKIKKIGFSFSQIKEDVEKIFPQFKNQISTQKHNPKAQLVILSAQEIPSLSGQYDLVLFPYFDFMISSPHLGARQKLFRLIQSLKSASAKKVYLFGENLEDNIFVQQLITNDWSKFLKRELQDRKKFSLPPFSKAILVESRAKSKIRAIDNLQKYLKLIRHPQANLLPLEAKTGRFKAKAIFYLNYNDWKKSTPLLKKNIFEAIILKIDPIDFV